MKKTIDFNPSPNEIANLLAFEMDAHDNASFLADWLTVSSVSKLRDIAHSVSVDRYSRDTVRSTLIQFLKDLDASAAL
jgi:hypothetical protein